MPLSLLVVVGLMLFAVVLAACGARSPGTRAPAVRPPAPPPPAAVTITRDSFHGWDALVLRNRALEVTVVPAIGRIMQIALRDAGGGAPGPVWSHPGIGPDLGGDENGWINLGGDKAWPAPQSGWEAVVGKGWPPPRTFDASPYEAKIVGDTVELLSAVDPAYGLRVRRTIALDPDKPSVTVETCYEKVAGRADPRRRLDHHPAGLARAAVHAAAGALDLPRRLRAAAPRSAEGPEVEGRLLSLARDPAAKTMLVSDGDALLWVGGAAHLLIEAVTDPHDPSDEWPDGAHAQIYTSSDEALPYVELELLSPLRDLRIGERASLRVRYTLAARTSADPTAEARRVLGL